MIRKRTTKLHCYKNTQANEHFSRSGHFHSKNWRTTYVSHWYPIITTYQGYQLQFLPAYNTHKLTLQVFMALLLMTDDWRLMIMKQNQLSQWSQSQIHLANHCENRLRISVGRPYVKNRNKTTFFLRRQIPGDQEDNLGVQNSCTWRSRPATWRNPQTNCEPNCWYLYGLCKRRRAEQSVNIHTLGCCVTCVSRLRHRTPRAVHTSTEHFC